MDGIGKVDKENIYYEITTEQDELTERERSNILYHFFGSREFERKEKKKQIIRDMAQSMLEEKKKLQKEIKEKVMKKAMYVLSLSILVLVVSCSSSPYKVETEARNKTLAHLSLKPEALDGEFDSKYRTSGKEGAYLKAVGSVRGTLEDDENYLIQKANFKAKNKLIEAAPSEFKSMIQQSVGDSVNTTDGGYERADISTAEVRALIGFESNEEDNECKRFSIPTRYGDYNYVKECRSIVKIPLVELEKAFKYTLKSKYGVQDKSLTEQLKNK